MKPRQAIAYALAQGVTFEKAKGKWYWVRGGKKQLPNYNKKSQAAYAAIKWLNR